MIEWADLRLVGVFGDPVISVRGDDDDEWEIASAARWNPRVGWHQPLGEDWLYQPDDAMRVVYNGCGEGRSA